MKPSSRTNGVVTCVVGHLGETERLEQRRHVDAEAAAQPFLEPVPAADGVVLRACPRLHGSLGCGFLLVCAAQRHPVAVRREHRVQILDRPKPIAQLRRPHLADDRGRIGVLVAVHRVGGAAGRRLQLPRIFPGAGAGCLLCHRQLLSRWTSRRPVEDVSVMRMRLALRVAVVTAACSLGGVGLVAPALAGPEEDLAAKYAPIVRLVDQPEECGPGEPYIPTDVDVLFDEPTVALRGPWNPTDLVKIAPTASDLVNRYEYHLDFPGDPLNAGCDYERWSRRITEGTKPTVYAHVASDPTYPGKLALQYWFFYPFNDFNNTHEGDWEMTQLVFDAPDATAALKQDPARVGYSSHEGAEGAAWGDEKLEIEAGTHPVVYPAAGSHANKFTSALYLGSSADAGVGCDDTVGPHREITPVVRTIPSDPAAASKAFPWIAFEVRWGELQAAFFNGPTGPNMKDQ